jgi:hypothetical protein
MEVMNARLKLALLCALLLFMVVAPLAAVPTAATPVTKEGTVVYESYEEYTVGTWATSTSLHFTVTSNATIDVYLLTSSDFINYPTGNFNPVKAVEGTTKADFKITASTSESYILVIDNQDTGRPGNTKPTGDISYTATYPNFMDTVPDTVNNIFNTCMISAIAAVVIVVIVVIVIIYLVVRKKPEPQPQVVMAPVAQAPYTPPPQAPAAPPQPPPSPYEPPPPDYQTPPQGQQYPPNPPQY